MSNDRCCVCNRAEDRSVDPETNKFRCELRPYGPGGKPICFQCAMSSPERTAEARSAMRRSLEAVGDAVVLDDHGFRAATPEERRKL